MVEISELCGASLLMILCAACGPVLPSEGNAGSADAAESGVATSARAPTTSGATTGDPDPDSTGTTGTTDTTDNTSMESTGACAAGERGGDSQCFRECSVILEDCPEGDKCVPWADDGSNEWNASRCSPLSAELAAEGEPCEAEGSAVSGLDNCAGGSMCWGVDPETLVGTCRSFCDPEQQGVCGESADCVPLNEGWVPVCLNTCNPLDPSTCADDEGCRFVRMSKDSYFSCLPRVGGVVTDSGMRCGQTSCGLDAMCLSGEFTPQCGDECCSPWCDLNGLDAADDTCALLDPALLCMPMFSGGPPPKGPLRGLAALGVCAAEPF